MGDVLETHPRVELELEEEEELFQFGHGGGHHWRQLTPVMTNPVAIRRRSRTRVAFFNNLGPYLAAEPILLLIIHR